MGKTMYTKMAPMTAKEKRSRDAEVASVLRFMQKHAVVTTPKTVYVKTKRVKDMDDGVAASASLVQALWRTLWRGFIARGEAAALKIAVAASKKAAAATAEKELKKNSQDSPRRSKRTL